MTDEQEMAALVGYTGKLETLSDNSVKLVVYFNEPERDKALKMLGVHGTSIAVALLDPEKATSTGERSATAPYGHEAKRLRQSSFFRSPDVWPYIGSDTAFLEWIESRGICVAKSKTPCDGQIVSAHIRRVKEGAGTGIKPKYCAVPMCHWHHSEQHQHGESAVGGKEYLDRQRIMFVEEWAWQTLKSILGYDHWTEVPPRVLLEWVQTETESGQLIKYLPEEYREAT